MQSHSSMPADLTAFAQLSTQPDHRYAGTLLMYAAWSNDEHAVGALLKQHGRQLANFCDYDKRTPLHVAASEGHMAIVKLLLESGGGGGGGPRVRAIKETWHEAPLDVFGRQVTPRLRDLVSLWNSPTAEHVRRDRAEIEPRSHIPLSNLPLGRARYSRHPSQDLSRTFPGAFP